MSKETAAEIGRAIGDAQKAKNLKEQQEAAEKKAESLRQEAEKKALAIQNEARLRATGVVALFEELRDSGILRLSEKPAFEIRKKIVRGKELEEMLKIADYTPAVIRWDHGSNLSFESRNIYQAGNKAVISIYFDQESYEIGGRGYDGDFTQIRESNLSASFTTSGRLKICGHVVEPGEELGEVVKEEILRLKGLKKE
jgi:hypothetical protein